MVRQLEKIDAVAVDAALLSGLAALANPVRLRIVAMLRQREQCVCHLTEALGLTQGTISYHVGVLKQAGIAEDRRDPSDARWVYYRLSPAGAAALRGALDAFLDTTEADPTPADCCPGATACPETGEGDHHARR